MSGFRVTTASMAAGPTARCKRRFASNVLDARDYLRCGSAIPHICDSGQVPRSITM